MFPSPCLNIITFLLCFISVQLICAQFDPDDDHSAAYVDDGIDGTIEGPTLTLSCTLCAQFFNISLKMRNSSAKEAIEEEIREEHCARIGVFKKICNKTLDLHYDQVYKASGEMGKDDVKKKCQNIGLCPSKRIPLYCQEYYDEGRPLVPNKIFGNGEF